MCVQVLFCTCDIVDDLKMTQLLYIATYSIRQIRQLFIKTKQETENVLEHRKIHKEHKRA